MATIISHPFESGLVLLVEPIHGARSVAIDWLVPAGTATDRPDRDGVSVMLSEFIFRGAGELSSRELSDAIDRIGAQRSSHASRHHLHINSTTVGERLTDLLPLVADIVRRPALPDEALDAVRSLCLQSLQSLEDEPQHLTMLRLREHHVAAPFNRSGYGQAEVLENAPLDELREAWTRRAVPGGSIVSIAGDVDPKAAADQLAALLDGWTGAAAAPSESAAPERGAHHVPLDTAQVHIGLAWDAPREADEHSMLERLAIAVLSGSSSSRLFTEVREKRSLCYAVHASYRADRDFGHVSLYAGTTPERAQETLDVSIDEINRLREGVTREEFDRAVIGLKSRLIMQGESTAARAGAIAHDYFRIGRPRTLDEIAAQIDAITFEQVNDYLASREVGEFTLVSIGPVPLTVATTTA